jgi:hypothetical protein
VIGDTLWMAHARSRITFIEVLLEVIDESLRRHARVVLYIVVGASALQTLVLVMWSSLFVSYIETSDGGAGAWVVVLLLLLSLRWTCGLIKHIVSVAVSGGFASWLAFVAAQAEPAVVVEGDDDLDLGYDLEDIAKAPAHRCVRRLSLWLLAVRLLPVPAVLDVCMGPRACLHGLCGCCALVLQGARRYRERWWRLGGAGSARGRWRGGVGGGPTVACHRDIGTPHRVFGVQPGSVPVAGANAQSGQRVCR